MQWLAVSTAFGAITEPVQFWTRVSLSRAETNAANGKPPVATTVPPMIDGASPVGAAAEADAGTARMARAVASSAGARTARVYGGQRGASAGAAALQVGRIGPVHVPDEAQAGEQSDEQPGGVGLAPAEAVQRHRRERVVVVVPALAEREQRHEEVVPARVAGLEGPRAHAVADRVDGE